MIEWSIAAFRACGSVRSIVAAVPPAHAYEPRGGELTVVAGGATRAQSVANALEAVETDLVAIHDAARPLLTPGLIEALVGRLDTDSGGAGVVAAAPVTDTVKQASASTSDAFTGPGTGNAALAIARTLDRSRLWTAQTPQLFRTAALREALAVDPEARDAATDEAMLVEAIGGRVLIHPTPAENLKVTVPLDLEIAEMLLSRRAGGGALPATLFLG